MTVRLANEIRPVDTPPYCSACGCQDPAKQHVDFDAACDRGYGEGLEVPMDDLILCEECLKTGARCLGMLEGDEPGEKIATLERRLEEERKRADQHAEYADRMEQALGSRPAPIKVSRPRGRPKKHIGEEDYYG